MTQEQLNKLDVGDLVRNHDGETFVVTANYGRRVTAVKTVDISSAIEWEIIRKAGADVRVDKRRK